MNQHLKNSPSHLDTTVLGRDTPGYSPVLVEGDTSYKKKVLFLDIDGCLNVEVFINALWFLAKRLELSRPDAVKLKHEIMRDDHGNLFCPTACNMLEWIIKETGADIVISSTWRHSGLEEMQKMWKNRGLAGSVIDITPSLRSNDKDLGFKERADRGREIEAWLSVNKVDAYAIIDDDDDFLPSQIPNFIQVDGMYGITNRDAEKVINILNSK